jgi:hypothetical protein
MELAVALEGHQGLIEGVVDSDKLGLFEGHRDWAVRPTRNRLHYALASQPSYSAS